MAPPDGVGTTITPWSGTLTLRAGDANSDSPAVATVEADTEGRFSTELPAGQRYCVLTSDRLDPLTTTLQAARDHPGPFGLDIHCVEREWRRCVAVLDVGATRISDAEIHVRSRCGWDMPCALRPPDPPPSAAPGG